MIRALRVILGALVVVLVAAAAFVIVKTRDGFASSRDAALARDTQTVAASGPLRPWRATARRDGR